ncbi:MAG: hypothetical protein IKP00_09405 [Victivallales bacterium]|nr:hypothetical protein [Victivallales bacterium]
MAFLRENSFGKILLGVFPGVSGDEISLIAILCNFNNPVFISKRLPEAFIVEELRNFPSKACPTHGGRTFD